MNIRRGYADGPFGQLHYEEAGDGVPIILLHQMVQSSIQFRPALPFLAAHGLHAIAVDLPGYGMSQTPGHAPNTEEYASIVPALLSHFELSQAVVCGHHTGASIACAVAHCYPQQISKLILHGVPYFTREEMAHHMSGPQRAEPIAEDGSHFQKVWDLFHGAGKGAVSKEATNWSILYYFMAGETGWHGHHAVFDYEIEIAAASINVPTLLMSNTGDMLNPQDRRLAEARPDFEFTEIQGGTFQYVYDEAEEWAALVADFATRI